MNSIGNIYVGDDCAIRMINSTGLFRRENLSSKIIHINIKKGYVSTLAGNITNCGQVDGNLSVALFNGVTGLYFDFLI